MQAEDRPDTVPRCEWHLLSFDVEEYFHAEAAREAGIEPEQWHSMDWRLRPRVERILELLSDHDASATFFVLGWVARHEPEIVRAIAQSGHEIASHGMTHGMLRRLTREGFRQELSDTRSLLEDAVQRPVVGYRAPTFSLTHETAWAIDVLAEERYRYDSSVFPIRHDRYGVPDAPRAVHRAIGPGGGEVLEIPPMTLRVFGANLPVGGGGYFRLFPVSLTSFALDRARGNDCPGIVYLHPWELDPDQPALPMSVLNRWRHRVNLRRTEDKLRRLLRRHRFRNIGDSLASLDSLALGTHSYGRDSPENSRD